ncbi:MAG TPA: hypothetical protein VJ952_10475 [Opitutales bacterium]|nr:hypothetical protein [Opitutales bacterium]
MVVTSILSPNEPIQTRQGGFALIASISIMAVLVLIGVALFSLSSVATRSAEIAAARTKAQANARMSLMIALGELQKFMGPDRRISARGLSLAQHPELDTSLTPESPNAWWVGVASSDSSEAITSNNQSVVWLLSGLDTQAAPEDQIGNETPFARPVPMYGANSIDLNLTGGQAISAGAMPIFGKDHASGSYAYFIDDEGLKAQLIPSDARVDNNDASGARPGGTTIPGSYDLSVLDGMDALGETSAGEYHRLFSLAELPLLSGDPDMARDKRLSYTTRSLGVLSDVKQGGLKKDLTIAFENHTTSSVTKNGATYPNMPSYPVFDEAFPKTSATEWGKYLLLDDSKHNEFGENGYIHWAMLRDYYNQKRYIQRDADGNDFLDLMVVSKEIGNGNYGRGILPPHAIGPESEMPTTHQNMPYGDYETTPSVEREFLEYYKHSPIMPVIAQFQYNVWLENPSYSSSAYPEATEALRIKTQIWVSHYNPFNISMRAQDAPRGASLRLIRVPMTTFSVPDSISLPSVKYTSREPEGYFSMLGLRKLQYNVGERVVLGPGRGQMCAFDKNANKFDSIDGKSYSIRVKDLTLESVFEDYPVLNSPLPSSFEWFVDIWCLYPYFAHGINGVASNSYEVSQILWAPLALEAVHGAQNNKIRSGKRLSFSSTTLNENTMGSFIMRLRSTNQVGDSIRPLVDANIRGFYFNPRWDSPLNLDMVAPYTWIDNNDDPDEIEQIPQMSLPEPGEPDDTGYSYWGGGHDLSDPDAAWDRVILFDIPRSDLVSLGQLQHANIGRFSYEPSYIVGNSYANPRIPLGEWKASIQDNFSNTENAVGFQTIPGSFTLYDASYLVNEALWDSYTFTTIPQVADNYDDADEPSPDEAHFEKLLSGEEALPNPRYLPYEPAGSSFDLETLQAVGDEDTQGSFHHNAGHLLVDGAFNVNSTSVDAWEAFLSGTHGMPYQELNANGQVGGYTMPEEKMVRFPRVESVLGGPMESGSPDENYWIGFRALEQTEVRELAEEIVDQIRERGPFFTLADFVNRKLEDGELGEKGALQAALDETVNANISGDFGAEATHTALPAGSNQAAGFPGQLLQGDILQALAPFMTVRSDTFTIRAYGESISPHGGQTLAKAWCEATIQRYPDPAFPDPNLPLLEELAQPSNAFGRRFRIVSFRWLTENDI